MVTMQISVSETAAKLIERTVREKQYSGPSEYIEGLVEADHASGPALRIKSEFPVAMEYDPAADIEVTPEYWEAKRQKLEAMIADDLDVDTEHRKWINAQLVEAYFVAPASLATMQLLPPALKGDSAIFPSAVALKKCEMIEDLGDALLLWDRIWTEVKVYAK